VRQACPTSHSPRALPSSPSLAHPLFERVADSFVREPDLPTPTHRHASVAQPSASRRQRPRGREWAMTAPRGHSHALHGLDALELQQAELSRHLRPRRALQAAEGRRGSSGHAPGRATCKDALQAGKLRGMLQSKRACRTHLVVDSSRRVVTLATLHTRPNAGGQLCTFCIQPCESARGALHTPPSPSHAPSPCATPPDPLPIAQSQPSPLAPLSGAFETCLAFGGRRDGSPQHEQANL
jgi:hypothetical protein